ncbi:MAG: class I SAM-dependent methyltransferase [Candidatus Falkowbacteria bacterium]|nr:class I SAM-dependent methyltransferase [Candidatus Falkowbacteria bacterium]
MRATVYYGRPWVVAGYLSTCNQTANNPWIDQIIFMLREKKFSPGGNLIDLGAGPGTSILKTMTVLNLKEFTLVDSSKEALKMVNEIYGRHLKFETVLADLQTEKIAVPSDYFDLATSFSTMIYLDSIKNLIEETARVLKIGGFFGLNCLFHDDGCKKPHHHLTNFEVSFYDHCWKYFRQEIGKNRLQIVDYKDLERENEAHHRAVLLQKF